MRARLAITAVFLAFFMAMSLHAQGASESGGNPYGTKPDTKPSTAPSTEAKDPADLAGKSADKTSATRLGDQLAGPAEEIAAENARREEERATTGGRTLGTGGEDTDLTWDLLKFLLYTLGFVAAIIVAVIFVKRSPKLRRFVGGGPIKIISRAFLGSRYAVHLVKIGNRILVIGQGPDGLRTLAEITDPEEVTRLLSDASVDAPESMTNTFRSALRSATGASGAAAQTSQKPAKATTASSPAPTPARETPKAAAFDATVSDVSADDGDGSIDVEPGYSSQLKLAALRAKIEKEKASS